MRKLFILILLFPFLSIAQETDECLSYREPPAQHYVRLGYENDYFTATDKLYTQGITLELVHPWLRRLPTSHLLLNPQGYTMQYGLAVQHNAYTANKIEDPDIRRGEHSFAAALMVQHSALAQSSNKIHRLASTISFGLLGPSAGGEWMQRTIHKAINGIQPQGWKNELQDDLILNYKVSYERRLLSWDRFIRVTGLSVAELGTLSSRIGLGGTFMVGLHGGEFAIYLYDHPQVNLIGYDATLQGGIFAADPYTIPDRDVKRVTGQNRYGIVIRYKRLYLEHFRQNISRTFSGGEPHAWGGVQIAYRW